MATFAMRTGLLFALATLATAGSAFVHASQDEADTCVRSKVWEAYPDGWAVRTITRATLGESEHRIYLLTLYAGNEYRFLSCGDTSLADADLVLYDADGKLLIQDDTQNRQPELLYRPTTTDTFYLAVHASRLAEGQDAQKKSAISTAVTYR